MERVAVPARDQTGAGSAVIGRKGSGAVFTVSRARRLQTNWRTPLLMTALSCSVLEHAVAEFLAQYEDAVRHTMKRRSFETYQSIAKVHLLPESGTSSSQIWDGSRSNICTRSSVKADSGSEGETDTRGALLRLKSRRQVGLDRA